MCCPSTRDIQQSRRCAHHAESVPRRFRAVTGGLVAGNDHQSGARAVLELDDVLWSPDDLRANARRSLTSLAAKHGETTHLAVLDAGAALCLDAVEGSHTLRVRGARVGTRLPARHCVIGKVLLAHNQVAGDPCRATPTDLPGEGRDGERRDHAELDVEFTAIVSEGIAYNRCTHTSEVHCVAAPIRDHTGFVVAAISLSAPTARFATAQPTYRQAVWDAAESVTAGLAITRTRRPSST